jgi:competence ComEA-like helix-hairpin-helix protein
MKVTRDEQRALAFVAALLFLSAAIRAVALPEPFDPPGSGGFDLAAHIEATEEAVAAAERRERPLADGETLDPNTAPADELMRLRGVGPALARRIVEDRTENGRYRTRGDLTRVPGIGERTIETLGPHLALPPGPPTGGPARGVGMAAESPAPVTPVGASASSRGPGAPRGGGAVAGAGSPGSAVVPIDLNAADADALVALPGVGPVLARRIVAYRDSAGPFRRLEDLVGVRGIGPATLSRIREKAIIR